VEDFGLTPLESLASGRPVVALRQGGVLDTLDEQTALFFDEQTVEGLVGALGRFDVWEKTFQPAAARQRALRFTKASFQAALQAEVAALGLSKPGP
jgi:glycosyltransferase involved in cell wall biosynthesis